ncbi:MAG: amidohydrolase family protein, partial [Thermoproteota archaeon]
MAKTFSGSLRRGLDLPIIDVHAHYGEWFFPIYKSGWKDIEELMKRHDVEAVILSSSKAIAYDMVEGNMDLSRILKPSEGLYGYVYVNPNYPELSKAEVDKYIENPFFKGIGEIHPDYSGIPVNSENNISIISEAAEYGKPFLIHTYSLENVNGLVELAKKFSGNIFIAGHMGGTTGSGTGLSWKKAIAAAKEYSNLYLEICITMFEKGKLEEAVDKAGVDKIMFGSDLTLLNPAHMIGMVLEAEISKNDKY